MENPAATVTREDVQLDGSLANEYRDNVNNPDYWRFQQAKSLAKEKP